MNPNIFESDDSVLRVDILLQVGIRKIITFSNTEKRVENATRGERFLKSFDEQ